MEAVIAQHFSEKETTASVKNGKTCECEASNTGSDSGVLVISSGTNIKQHAWKLTEVMKWLEC